MKITASKSDRFAGAALPPINGAPRAGRAGRSVRTPLLAIVLAGLVPAIVFAATMVYQFAQQHREAVRERLVGVANAVSIAIDHSLVHEIESLKNVARSELFERSELAALYAYLGKLQRQEGWLALAVHDRTDMRQVLNTAAPFGTELPYSIDPDSLSEVAESARPLVAGITGSGSVLPGPFVLIRVPVIRDGEVRFVLSAAIPPAHLNAILSHQHVPAGSVIAALDPRMRIAARNRTPEQFIGTRATTSLTDRIALSDTGMFLATNKEGESVYTVFRKSTETGWTVALGIPAAIIDRPLHRTILTLGAIGTVLAATGIGLATLVGRAMTRQQQAELELGQARAELAARERADLIAAKEAAERDSLTKGESLKVAEAQLRQVQKLEALGQLTGGMAHDFNNLLLVIMGNAELLADPAIPSEEGSESVRMIRLAAERGSELTHRLLSFARRQALQPAQFDLNGLVANMGELLKRTLGGNIAIHMNLAADLYPALADPAQVESALLNLALNARDAMPEGGRLVIETANVAFDESYAAENEDVTSGSYVMVAVSDTGTGMSADVAARVFEPFFTTKDVGKGSGLGLSMVYGFASQSQGQVKIESELGEGTTVRLYLPKAEVVAQGEQSQSALAYEGGSETILVVEDEAMVRQTVVAQLRSLGYDPLEAESGVAALETLERFQGQIELILTDVIMPGGMDGRQLAAELRRRYPQVKVLFTSGYAQNSPSHSANLEARVQFLQKPYRKADLAEKLRQMLRDS